MLALLLVDTMGGLLSELTVRPYYKLEKFIAARCVSRPSARCCR